MLNEITLMGRLTQTPELKKTKKGDTVVDMCLACDRDIKNKDGSYDTDFIRCTAWGDTAEFAARYFTKGQTAIVKGRLQIGKYTDKNGQSRIDPNIRVEKMYFAGGKEKTSEEPPKQEDDRYDEFSTIDDTEDLPF